jgi:anti-anti-sigma factor
MPVSELTVQHVRLAPEHALIVARGVIDEATVAEFHSCLEQVLDAGARYLVADLAHVTGCDSAALPALAAAARRLSAIHGWLRLVATSEAVIATVDDLDLRDVLDLYRAHNAARDGT